MLSTVAHFNQCLQFLHGYAAVDTVSGNLTPSLMFAAFSPATIASAAFMSTTSLHAPGLPDSTSLVICALVVGSAAADYHPADMSFRHNLSEWML